MARPYRLNRRAEAQERTRQKIVDAAIALHQAKGIAETTVSDVAARAKVGKVTVYRHFPDEAALLDACSGQYFSHHPPPDPDAWRTIPDAAARLRRGLSETYAYHRETEAMIGKVLPEARDLPIMEPYHALWRQAVDVLAEPFARTGEDAKPLKAALALALSFDTWRLLVREHRLPEDQAIVLMERLIRESLMATG